MERTPATYRTIRELDATDRPRERLLKHGPEVLSDSELLAIVLGSGSQGENVVDLSRRILEAAGGLAGIAREDGEALRRTRGVGPAKAAQIAAAVELGRRVQLLDVEARPLMDTPEAVVALLGARLLGRPTESLFALSLDTRGRLLGGATPVLEGTVNAVSVRPAEVFREPMLLHATCVVLAHNHPSGDPAPSTADIAITRTLVAAGRILDLEVVDHVVLGANRWVSMRREGHAFR